MDEIFIKIILVWFAVISIVAVIITVTDKRKARRGAYRISEAALMWISALGGSVAMLVTMLTIRHKTRHIKFMLGIPIIILFQIIVAVYLIIRLL
jgi:uncharacterized membrane protein YsdA (DUF1294 family)